MMIRPRSLHLTPTPSFSTITTASLSTIPPSSSTVVGPVSPPATPLLPSSPDSMVSPSLFPSPSSSSRSMSIRENVQVVVRLRPPSTKERTQSEEPCWHIGPDPGMIQQLQTRKNQTAVFQYDSVVSGVDNKLVYDTGIGDLVRSTMAGYNGTVFAYGQTASGKTYTMMGTPEQPGVIPRAINELFAYIEENPGREFMLRVSYLEIYKEKIRDLISNNNQSIPEVREDKKRGVYVRNLREVIVTSAQQVLDVIKKGEDNRHISATDYNTESSRSHTILQIVIESRSKDAVTADQGSVCVSQLNLIDLAGSEKATSDIDRRQEGGYINKSLLALGNVISQLINKMNNEKVHVQYRSSTLTRVLQTALSGNARISIVCTINPTWKSKDESLNTLRFAQRAKQIRTSAKMTKINEHSELQKCLSTIAELQTRMQEKTEQEFETKERLSHLLSLILTSSKNAPPTIAAVSKLADRVITGDSILSHSTMQEVFAQCEQGLTATREEMGELQESLEAERKLGKENEKIMREQERQIQTASQTIADLEFQISSCEKEIEELEAKLAASNDAYTQMEAKLAASNDAYTQMEAKLAASNDAYTQMEAQLFTSNRDRDEYAQQVEEYRENIKQLSSRMASLENELVSSLEKQEDLVQVIVTKDGEDDERIIELKKLTESLQDQVTLLQEQLEESTTLSESFSSTMSTSSEAPLMHHEQQKHETNYQHQQQQLQQQIEKSNRLEELEKELATCTQSLDDITAKSVMVEKELASCMKALQDKTAELFVTKKQLEKEQYERRSETVTMTVQTTSKHDINKKKNNQLNIPVFYGGMWTMIAATAMYAFSIGS